MSKKNPAITRCPSPIVPGKVAISNEEKIEKIAFHFEAIMETLGLDLSNTSLKKTPKRVASMYVNEIFSGLDYQNFPETSFFNNVVEQIDGSSQLVTQKIEFFSFCEHHFVPMEGDIYIAYVPNKKWIGLSKMPRVVRYFACRPQLQERLTAQIADALSTLLETEDVAVMAKARHYCVMARGIEDKQNYTSTQILMGKFKIDPSLLNQFFKLIEN